ncbi:krueppel-like factor 16 [Lentinula aciculospora]|uniref:Krueppel-like factor 16 n=1 Tax=Lentinula aciculospora TaxID=153920 RepID=A0A9W9DNH7_9AGAR|nr:krueppel-like factor 16 [Lentinula aciculospora]
MDARSDGSPFINDLGDFHNHPASPPVTFEVIPDHNEHFINNGGSQSPSFPSTELDISSYNNSPFSTHSELSFDDDLDYPSSAGFGLFSAESNPSAPGYDPSEYDNPTGNSLLMFNDNDYLSSYQGNYGDYSSPGSSNGSVNEGIRSRASSVSSNHQQPQSHLSPNLQARHLPRSPHMAVAQSFEGMSFHSPAWGNDPLPEHSPRQAQFQADVHSRSLSPQRASGKPQSPPRLLMPDDEVPIINAPDDGDGGAGPALRIVPATPVSGGGVVINQGGDQGSMSFRHDNSLAPFSNNQIQPWTRHTSPHPPDPDTQMDTSSGRYQNFNSSSQPQPGSSRLSNSNAFLFPGGTLPRTRSKSDGSLEQPSWDNTGLTSFDESAIADDGTVNMTDVSPPNSSNPNSGRLNSNFSFGGSPTSPQSGAANAFLSVEASSLRRSKSDSYGRGGAHVRGSRSEDLRFGNVPGINIAESGTGQQSNIGGGQGNGLLFPPSAHGDFIQHQQEQQRSHTPQYLLPRGHGHSYSYSGSNSGLSNNYQVGTLGLGSALPNLGAGMGLSSNIGAGQRQGSPMSHIRRASSGSRSERGVGSWSLSNSGFDSGLGLNLGPGSNGGSNAGSISGSLRASPYPSPNVSPRGRYNELPSHDTLDFGLLNGGNPVTGFGSSSRSGTPNMPTMGLPSLPPLPTPANTGKQMPSVVAVGGSNVSLVVSKPNVTTGRTAKASHNRRKQEATFVCPIPGCGSTFTRSFNLKGALLVIECVQSVI